MEVKYDRKQTIAMNDPGIKQTCRAKSRKIPMSVTFKVQDLIIIKKSQR